MSSLFPKISLHVESMTLASPSRRPTASSLLRKTFSREAKERADMKTKVGIFF
jgi:hypothetical protein